MSQNAIDVRNLTYRAKEHFYSPFKTILSDISFAIQHGKICGFVGANGAGKTTTMQMLLGQLKPTSGKLWLMEQPPSDPASRRCVGYLPERQVQPQALSAHTLVKVHGQLRGLCCTSLDDEVQRAISLVGLHKDQHRPVRHFSKGMLQRLGLAQALVGRPKLLLLDEPLSGLDPPGRHLVRELLLDLRRQGCTVFFSTHILSDVELLCDQVVVLQAGSVAFSGSYAQLSDKHANMGPEKVEVVGHKVSTQVLMLAENLAADVTMAGQHHRFIARSRLDANKIAQAILASGGSLSKFAPFGTSALEALLLAPQPWEGRLDANP